ncbi:fibronectin type 3 domain-containing protein [Sulfurospirillum barnesii SES-3]|uniref:Fibronectin type 3 domain-containing protein n=2 Tax=Sulfurospirillum barnesii TaxID=44674 RepID=I3XVM6_SULBS|nr:fibronectin type 3 domain-containing protein [Sulfurospirillum barnesii SES-3]
MALALMISGCTKTLETPKEPVIDASLPLVENIRTLASGNEIGFEWTPIYGNTIEGYYLYRLEGGRMKKIATIKDKYVSHYVDTKLAPNTTYSYQMSTYASDKHESAPSLSISATTTMPVAKTPTVGVVEPVSFFTAISGLPAQAKVIWRPHALENVTTYIIERNEYKSTSWDEVGKVEGRLNAEFIDKELLNDYVYRYRVKVKTHDGVLSAPSQVVEARTKAAPRGIVGVQATSDLPKKILLTWEAFSEADFAYYKIYRSPTSSLFYSFYGKTNSTAFEDLINDNGKMYYYKVVAVDKDGLESKQPENPVVGMTRPILSAPLVHAAKYDGRSVFMAWNSNENAIKYTITKEFKSAGETKTQSFTGIFENNFQDTDILLGVTYKYNIIAIDKFGIASKPSDSVMITIPKE